MAEQAVRKTYKYKLKPTPAQEQALAAVLYRWRTRYTAGLEQRRTWWERGQGTSATCYQQQAELPDLKGAFPEYADVTAQVLQEVLLRLDRACHACFRRVQAGETPGYPRFQGRERSTSFTYKQIGEHGGARLNNGFLVLSKVGRIAVRWSRPLAGTPKTVPISREADGWHACFSCADVPGVPLSCTGCETGIAVGLKVFLITADGKVVENPRHHRTVERRLAKAQRRVSRRKQGGSTRRRKALALRKRKYQQVQRQRRDFPHKTARALRRQYDTIELEEVPVRNLVRTPHRATSSSDAGWAAFRSILTSKAAYAGKWVVAVPPAFTSQDCSGVLPDGSRCPQWVAKSFSVRTHACPSCGLVLDRDEHAAKNMLRAGQARQALTQRGAAYVA